MLFLPKKYSNETSVNLFSACCFCHCGLLLPRGQISKWTENDGEKGVCLVSNDIMYSTHGYRLQKSLFHVYMSNRSSRKDCINLLLSSVISTNLKNYGLYGHWKSGLSHVIIFLPTWKGFEESHH